MRIVTVPRPPVASPELLAIGLMLSDGRTIWTDCVVDGTAVAAATLIEEVVTPALVGVALANYRTLVDAVAALKHTVSWSEVVVPAAGSEGRVSRRAFLSGLTQQPLPEQRTLSELRPLPASLRCALNTALLAAVAVVRGVAPAAVLAADCEVAWEAGRPLALMAQVDVAAHTTLLPHMAAVTHRTSGREPIRQLGENCQLLQRYVRELKDWLIQSGVAEGAVAIHLDVRGGIGAVYNNQIGKMLGALYGLEVAARPYPLLVADPVLLPTAEEQFATLKRLRDYFRFRKMKLKLVVREGIDSAAAVDPYLAGDGAHLVTLNPATLGGYVEVIDVARQCRQAGVGLVLQVDAAAGSEAAALGCNLGKLVGAEFVHALGSRDLVVRVLHEANKLAAFTPS